MANTYLPIGLSLTGRSCLVVGGGNVGLRKVETLLDYDCKVTVVAPDPVKKLEYFQESKRITLEKREYEPPEAGNYDLVISAADSKEVNKKVFEDCGKAGIPVNVVDNPPLCTFIFPGTVKRGSLSIAVSTDGTSPFLAGHLRVILEEIFPDRWKRIADHAAVFRVMVRRRFPKSPEEQGKCYERFIMADWKEIFKKGDVDIESLLEGMLEEEPVPEDESKG